MATRKCDSGWSTWNKFSLTCVCCKDPGTDNMANPYWYTFEVVGGGTPLTAAEEAALRS